jgi:ADP-dependent NAD(P)H-hydrate dehydratase / NAD(P)H-hydrate epimerase
MQKILSTTQIKELDAYTITHEPIASIDLMERACKAFTSWFMAKFDTSKKIGVVCGTGNNGGDGLGIARLLTEWGYPVMVWVVRGSVAESNDFKINLKRLDGVVKVKEINTTPDDAFFSGVNVLIDALFGSGLSRPMEGMYAQVVRAMNQAKVVRVAVDIPSGLMADRPSVGEIVQAHHTTTFQLPKLSFLLPECFQFTGNWKAVDIGLSKEFIRQTDTDFFLLERRDIKRMIRKRSKHDHKGNFGHALLIAGSYGKMGAALLGAKAVMRSGAGLLTVHLPKCGYEIIQMAVPEAMISVDESASFFTSIPGLDKFSAIGVGPGLGQDKQSVKALAELFEKWAKPMVIDADALNILAANPEFIYRISQQSILTPHPREFQRLVGEWKSDFDRLDKQREFSVKTGSVVLLKGANTSVAAPDGKLYFNNTGNPGMATGGSGDVLTGILTGLLAQGYSALEAARIGVWVHGLAGDYAARDFGQTSMIASDLIDKLPDTFKLF